MFKYHHIKRRTAIITAAISFVAVLASCTKNFEKINAVWNGSASATFTQVYTSIGGNLDATAEGMDNVGARWLYPITQLGAVYAASDYGYGGGGNWNGFYQNLAGINQMFTELTTNPDSANYTNAKAMLKVLRAYQALELSNLYGDIPYSRAGKAFSGSTADLVVPYDKQQAVYVSCLKDLTWAVDNFNTTSTTQFSFGAKEFLLQNNISQWVKFANSLRLRYALTIYDKDAADAGPVIADAMTKPLLTDAVADVVGLYASNIPGISFDLGGGGRAAFFHQESRARMGSTVWNLFSSNNNKDGSGIFDPRCKIYFEVNGNNEWVPYPQNPVTPINDGVTDPYKTERDGDWTLDKAGNLFSDYNYYWGRDGLTGPAGTVPEIFISTAEVHFLKAEVYARGIAGVAANMTTAQSEYEAGIKASITFWTTMAYNSPIWVVNKPAAATPSDAEVNAVLTNPKVAFNAANAVSLIYAQEWVDLFRQPWVAWTLMRRTGYATPADPANPAGYTQNYGSLQRYQYPGDEQLYNNANWKAATGGSDLTSTKLWITK